MNEPLILEERQDQVVVLTLNRPAVMNSFNFPMLLALKEKVEALHFDPEVRAVIITGAGEKAFCAGADLKERASMSEAQVREFIFTIRNLFTFIEYLNQPVIAALNGVALGGGTELALACDIRIASATASLGLTETRLAIIPGAGGLGWWGAARPRNSFLRASGSRPRRPCASAWLIKSASREPCWLNVAPWRRRFARPVPSPSGRPNMLLITVSRPICIRDWPLNQTPTG
jgi:Enoyl-CoA hydratase/isomerase